MTDQSVKQQDDKSLSVSSSRNSCYFFGKKLNSNLQIFLLFFSIFIFQEKAFAQPEIPDSLFEKIGLDSNFLKSPDGPIGDKTQWERFVNMFSYLKEKEQKALDSLKNYINGLKDVEGEGIIQDYPLLYRAMNFGVKKNPFDSLLATGTVEWDSIQDIHYIKYETSTTSLDSNFQTFGWHPYWMGTAYKSYNFKLLSRIAFFSYDINPQTGNYASPEVIDDWKSTGLIDSAHQAGCKVLLTITNLGAEDNRIFLDNSVNQHSVLFDSLLFLVNLRGADGIDINFEQIPIGYGPKFSAFIKALSVKFKTANKDFFINLTIPKVNNGQIPDIENLNEYVDAFVLTGYDFHMSTSGTDGPVAPLRAKPGDRSIETIVDAYLREGIDIDKLILALPYYGAVWRSGIAQMESSNAQFEEYLTYRNILSTFQKQDVPNYDSLSSSAYYLIKNGDVYTKCWFDDTITYQVKFDWIKEKKLAGVGFWALGYDNGHTDLWQLIDKEFSADSILVLNLEPPYTEFHNFAIQVMQYKEIIIVAGIFVFVFLIIGLVVSLFDWRVREVFFGKNAYLLMYVFSAFFFLIFIYIINLILQQQGVSNNSLVNLFVGLIIGSIVAFFLGKRYGHWKRNLP